MKSIALALALMLQATAGFAACRGIDYRAYLPPATQERLDRAMAATPFSEGNHWVATKGSRSIHVIGTMHGGDARMAKVMRTLRPALASAQAIYLETSDQDMQRLDRMPPSVARSFLLPQGRELRQLLPPESWEQFELTARISGANLDTVNRMQPWAISMFLVQSGCRPYGFGLRRGLDDRISDFARRNRIPLGALETPEQALAAVSSLPLRDQARMLQLELELIQSDKPEDATPVEAYFDQSVWTSFVLAPWISAQYSSFSAAETERLWAQYNRRLLDQRNIRWMKVIQAAQQERFVVAVGAAHLPGRNGLLNLLKARGFSLARAPW
ncbi:TraB/GumN family protein [Leisingera aquaemixtae]|uniref:TraB/GumN family protein n=1 Tax=Leisingera TaxID=191028 RepID=UPI001C989B90|nr:MULTISPECIES: TraB/GumN family protein [Leisingera]MBY6066762.1 TraB/GumN family protein [Leisingera aquaemixtae]MCB4458354.1 TraB/GumN family protein [Leisingera sp. McT4-56]